MAGPYTHLLLADALCLNPTVLDTVPGMVGNIRAAILSHAPFCRLGAVSPDCPAYVKNTSATGWGNVMHYWRTADIIRRGIGFVLAMDFRTTETQMCLAWLFGYTTHLVADLTVHPVVAELVGPYKGNEQAHSACEKNQDAYLFQKHRHTPLQSVKFDDVFQFSACSQDGNTNHLNRAISTLWSQSVSLQPRKEIKMKVRRPSAPPRPDNWYATFFNLMRNFAPRVYPAPGEIQAKYLANLPTPSGTVIHVDALFDLAVVNIKTYWAELAAALNSKDVNLFTLPNANLDTGKIDGTDQYVFPL